MRRIIKKYAVAAVVGAACLGLAVLIVCDFAKGANASVDKTYVKPATSRTVHPFLLDSFEFITAPRWHGLNGVQLPLRNGDPFGHPTIKKVVVVITLTPGEYLRHSKFTVSGSILPRDRIANAKKAKLQRFVRLAPAADGSKRFEWVYLKLTQAAGATWHLWVSPPPGSSQPCITATAQPYGGPKQTTSSC